MAVILNASTSTGFVQSADTSGILQIQSNGTTELTVASTGVTVADNLLFNSGYGSAAVGYGCRAWVNFNGTGTVAIRASGNVTSITDGGTGIFTVNFTTAMPDANYCACATAGGSDLATAERIAYTPVGGFSTTTLKVRVSSGGGAASDVENICVSIFR